MPYQPKQNARSTQLVLTDAQGKSMPLSFYDQATGRMTATLYQSGVYTVEEVNAPSFSAPTAEHDVYLTRAQTAALIRQFIILCNADIPLNGIK